MTTLENSALALIKQAAKIYVQNNDEVDWEQRRYEIARDAMKAIIPAEMFDDGDGGLCKGAPKDVAKKAVRYADALIEELKK